MLLDLIGLSVHTRMPGNMEGQGRLEYAAVGRELQKESG